MPEPNSTPEPLVAEPVAHSGRRRLIVVLAVVFALLLALLLPPYINVNRFKHRVASNISASLGRPVHFDNITLNLLPSPGFSLDNFVVEEDPAFGSEPILRANQVRADLHIRSIWSRRVELSKIVLTEPSVNLVHSADGQWNIESLLLHASHSEAAPTAQSYAGPALRFPYIEATGARLNLKLDQVKSPYSLTDADFALWLPEPHQWRIRVEAHPVRTDTSPADTGILRLEATLGAPNSSTPATSLSGLPIDLHGDWKNLQLGALSRLLIANDAGLRGELTLNLHILGTLGQNTITTNLSLANARRADFVPPHPLSLEADCHATAQNTFHTFANIACNWPPSSSSDPKLLALTASLPDLRQPNSAIAALAIPALPADTFFNWLSVATPHPPTGLTGPGILSANLNWTPESLSGQLEFSHESLQIPALDAKAIPLGNLVLRSTPTTAPAPHSRHEHTESSVMPTTVNKTSFDLLPITIPLGGKQSATLEGHFDVTGYTLHLTGIALPAHLLAIGDAIPQLGDGLRSLLEPTTASTTQTSKPAPVADPIHIDLTATRVWGGPQTWHPTAPMPPPSHKRTKH